MNEVRRAAEILRAGGLVAFPTETVYGLGADASSEPAMARLYRVKGRPAGHPVIVHFASAAEAFQWGEPTQQAKALAQRFWPGPLTLILKRTAKAKDFVTGGQPSVGVRVPSHPVARELLQEFGKRPPPTASAASRRPPRRTCARTSAATSISCWKAGRARWASNRPSSIFRAAKR
jgi:tRNA threonylcarbamoyl adenosine modification protein (Sua5/YciO/YrdC/YwlC family)